MLRISLFKPALWDEKKKKAHGTPRLVRGHAVALPLQGITALQLALQALASSWRMVLHLNSPGTPHHTGALAPHAPVGVYTACSADKVTGHPSRPSRP